MERKRSGLTTAQAKALLREYNSTLSDAEIAIVLEWMECFAEKVLDKVDREKCDLLKKNYFYNQ